MPLRKNLRRRFIKAKSRLSEKRESSERTTVRLPGGEILGLEPLRRKAAELASSHDSLRTGGKDKLLSRLSENEGVLIRSHESLTEAFRRKKRLTPAEEWLVDNFYLIEEQIQTVGRHFPRSYGQKLPHLASGPFAGYPRVYALVLDMLAWVDDRVDESNLSAFVKTYQETSILTIGELWAVPIMLRLALIEKLRHTAARIVRDRTDRESAASWAEKATETAEKDPGNLVLLAAEMARADLNLSSAFTAEFSRLLHGQNPKLVFLINWIEQRLNETGLTIEQQVFRETHQQTLNQASIANNIASFRFLESTDWQEFVENTSPVESVLRADPADIYNKMDFLTRDHYRDEVEKIARQARRTEKEVAETAVGLAMESGEGKENRPRDHVGFYLVGHGRHLLENAAGVQRAAWREKKRRAARKLRLPAYLAAAFLLNFALTLGALEYAYRGGADGRILAFAGIAFFIALSHLSFLSTGWLFMGFLPPRPLPRMDYSDGIPPEARTLVAVPCLLTGHNGVGQLLENLEMGFLANPGKNICWALLTDFCDAPREKMPGDEELFSLVENGIRLLNEKYASEDHQPFLLFHRPRNWNSRQRAWMGYERKRGKLEALNAFIREGDKSAFSRLVGEETFPSNIRYVVTLDADTVLPRDSVQEMASAMSHPLNRPRVCPRKNRVIEGYGVLQPRLAVNLVSSQRSRFARLFSGEPGLDPYTRLVSDLYQDIFEEGSFLGKGIYDVETFRQVLEDRFPENLILSHDLLEGCHIRSGLISDVILYEDFPATCQLDMQRRHRWVRGDWQIINWLLPWVPSRKGLARNAVTGLGRWKIFDNLRRSLVPPAMFAALVSGWINGHGWAWTLAIGAAALAFPVFAGFLALLRKDPETTLLLHLRRVREKNIPHLVQAAWMLASLPTETLLHLDAAGRTLYRLLFTRRNLLEWKSFGETLEKQKTGKRHRWGMVSFIWAGPGFALVLIALLSIGRSHALAPALPFIIAWSVLPLIAWILDRPRKKRITAWSQAQKNCLRRLALKYWSFFENFVDKEHNWLPPDNYQEAPVRKVAHRTSPTNIGLALLSTLAARDFGFVTAGRCLKRIENAFQAMDRMERFRGHFYNWYDTRTLEPLPPRYVSSVDSGNLCGHLLVLAEGLRETASMPVLDRRLFSGLGDALDLLAETAGRKKPEGGRDLLPRATRGKLVQLAAELDNPADSFAGRCASLARVCELAWEIFEWSRIHPHTEMEHWSRQFLRQCRDILEEIEELTPWALEMKEDCASVKPGGIADFKDSPTLADIIALADKNRQEDTRHGEEKASPERAKKSKMFALGAAAARRRLELVESLAAQCRALAEVEYDFLFDRSRKLLSIGYRVPERKRDEAFYDLLASEARLGSFVAIAEGQLPQRHWFSLGRLLTMPGTKPALISWSGSMFEYLMPSLVMPDFEETLIAETLESAIAYQCEYGRSRGVPWGFSESCYNSIGTELDYQYNAFGVPELGLKRGLAEDLVVAPYATVMALMVSPETAWKNLSLIMKNGFEGHYGLYEAIDYTPARLPRGEKHVVIQSFMAHHQGMSLLSLAHTLLDQPMQKRFRQNPAFRATELLLQEKISQTRLISPRARTTSIVTRPGEKRDHIRVFKTPDTRIPQVHLLSNGKFTTVISAAGAGYSRWRGTAVNRWREDTTRDDCGTFAYLRDLSGDLVWSTAHQPIAGKTAREYEAVFSQSRAEIKRVDGHFITHTEVAVSSEEDIEVRRVSITNRDREARLVEMTSYLELALVPQSDYLSHPAFNNLFVRTEIAADGSALIASRRPRSREEKPCWALHLITSREGFEGPLSSENNRERFLGRHGSTSRPEALEKPGELPGASEPTIDPIFSLRGRVRIPGGETRTIYIVTGVAASRDEALELAGKYRESSFADRAFELAWTHSQVLLQQLDITEAEAQLYGNMAGSIIYNDSLRRARPGLIASNRSPQSDLWGYGISGDYPIVLLRVESISSTEIVKQLVRAHAYWRNKGLTVELVIWNEESSGYQQLLQDHLTGIVSTGSEAHSLNARGGIFIIASDRMPEDDRTLMQSFARLIFSDRSGTLDEQAEQRGRKTEPTGKLKVSKTPLPGKSETPLKPFRNLLFDNGYGGFRPGGREYAINLPPGNPVPAPWVNIIANPVFGFAISESGSAFTWRENAHEYRLTPWYNDPVSDRSGEAFYLRDEESGVFWSLAPLPAPGQSPYRARHGFGYSVFESSEQAIEASMTTWVDIESPVRFVSIRLHNRDIRARRLSLTGYVEWVLGQMREETSRHVVTTIGAQTGALTASNAYNPDFPGHTAFFTVNDLERMVTCDRAEFIGRNGSLAKPEAMQNEKLSGRTGAGLDPCGAIRTLVQLEAGEKREIVFLLGAGRDREEARSLAQCFQGLNAATESLEKVEAYWKQTLGAVEIETENPEIDFLANGWLLYQTISARIMGRTGYYQSSGAFGFRDQLQDALATVHADPAILRRQILTCAEHQFPEGDVQHWWHPPTSRGVRTRITDDLLWLPVAVSRYLQVTGDDSLLDETAPFLEGRPLRDDEDEYYDLAKRGDEVRTIYEHCRRAINRSLRYGPHGLPLMGGGDWNDGMNRVGIKGRGESAWLGFFLFGILESFEKIALGREDNRSAGKFRQEADRIRENLEKHAWDGAWYLRAWFDDGKTLGSARNAECRIDSLSQSWAVLSGAADPDKARKALDSARRNLVDYRARLIRLLKPAFDTSDLDPGYIKGYQPGVRENGGQYTQAAAWFVMALAETGQAQQAWKMLEFINPINHGLDRREIETYRVEPYVTAGDVYDLENMVGRGGWSWYTGSAGWMYQLIIEKIVGLRRAGNCLALEPRWPDHWKEVKIRYRFGQALYRIRITRDSREGMKVGTITIDGEPFAQKEIPLIDAPGKKEVLVELD